MCSRVCDDGFYEFNALLSVKVSDMNDYLGISCLESVDFDVFLTQPGYFSYAFCESGHKCTHHQVFSYAHDLLVAFCSIFIRRYLNLEMKIFSNLISNISLVDEKKLLQR